MLAVGDLLILSTAIYFDERLVTADRRFYETASLIYGKIKYLKIL